MNRHLLLFLGPCVVALMAFFAAPVWQTFVMSMHADSMAPNPAYVGLSNYIAVISDRNFTRLMTTSVIYTVGNVFFVWLFGLGIALLLNRNFFGRGLIRTAFIIPWAMPYVAASLVFALMFNYDVGILNYLLSLVSSGQLRIDYLTSCPNALISLTGISVWKLLPLGIVMMLSGLQSIPDSQYEAAEVDGATALQRFWFVTLPGLRSTTVTLTLLMMIWCFGRSFTAIYLLTGGGPAGCSETLVLKSYIQMFQLFKPATAATLGVGVLIVSLVCAVVYITILSAGSRENG